jgi:hypothetical protein
MSVAPVAGESKDPAALPEGEPRWARLFLLEGEIRAMLLCRNLPVSKDGETYALWSFTQQEGSPKKNCCLFRVNASASEMVWLELKAPLDLKQKDLCFGVTREKAGVDLTTPQGDLLLLGKVKP